MDGPGRLGKVAQPPRHHLGAKLPDDIKQGTTGETAAIALMLANPSLIKRPVLELEGHVYVGFDEPTYARLFNRQRISP